MKKTVFALAALAVVAAPLAAQAHRAWIAPSSTVLSGADGWISIDAGMSNGVFIADHAPMRLDGLVITAPDGSVVSAENEHRARYRSTFDVHLTQPGTYKIANISSGFFASYTLDGERQRWRGAASEFPAALPEGATEIELFFDYGKDIDIALRDASTRLDRAKRVLPTTIDPPIIFKRDPSQIPVMEFVIRSRLRDMTELRL
ncbi:MAG: efflux RND transporter permease subunit, partial [Brevundimonas sp.]